MNKKNIGKILFFISLLLLLFVFSNLFFSSIFLIFKIYISSLNFILSLIFSILLDTIIIKNYNLSFKSYIVIIFISLITIFSSIIISGNIYDYTYDGNGYHKHAIGELKDGWNPVYKDLESFDKSISTQSSENYIWINSYAKGAYLFGANVYKVTNNIESAKCINIISVVILYCFILSILLLHNYNTLFSLLISFSTISFSVVGTQIFTNYIDLLVYIYFCMLICCLFLFESKEDFITINTKLFIYLTVLCIIINLKFSVFGYAGIYCMGYLIWYIIRVFNRKLDRVFLKKYLIVSCVSFIIGVFLIGLSTYPKNFFEHGHPFYPLMGKNKLDIITKNSPKSFEQKKPLNKFLISNFSYVNNIYYSSKEKPHLKIPFSIKKSELYQLKNSDTRISGGGVLFSGLLIISTLFYLVSANKTYKDNKNTFYLIYIFVFITIGFIFAFDEVWWIRYFPQEYIYVLLSLIIFNYVFHSKKAKVIKIIFISILLLNNMFNIIVTTLYVHKKNEEFIISSNKLKNSCLYCTRKICTNTENFNGVLYNINDSFEDIIIEEKGSNIKYYNDKYFGYVEWRCCK